MADITLRVNGDASSGKAAMQGTGEAIEGASMKWAAFASAAAVGAKAVIDFGVASVKAYAESERIQRQLVRASGDYAEALDEQSKALSRLFAVDDDVIKQSQILLTQWGGVGAAQKDVEQAALNLASAMGTNLQTATSDLIRNVESGGVSLGKLGVHFKVTGDRGKDLEAAVAAINAKFGGAAASDAASLIGRTHAASVAFEDLQKSIGAMLATAADKTGALEMLTDGLRKITKGGEVAFAVLSKLPSFLGGVLRGNIDASTAVDELKQTAMDAFLGGKPASESNPAAPGVTGTTNKGLKEAAKGKTQAELNDESLENAKKFQRGLDELDDHADELATKETDRVWNVAEEEQKSREAAAKGVLETDRKLAKDEDELRLKLEKEEKSAEDKALKDSTDRAAKKEKEAAHAADAIGAAFVNALSDQLSKLAEGGEFDAALFIGDIMAAAVGVAGGIIGTALGAPAVGAAVGNLAAMGIRAGSSAISQGNKKAAGAKQYHDGGWVDAPRFHDGTWIAPDEQRAILQRDERVLSRREVQNAGGPAAVDRMAKGGGGLSVTIHAIDSKSAADSFASDLGRGLRQAIRSGRGDVPSVLGVGVR